MLTPQIINKMNQLKTALEANPEFIAILKNTANEHPLFTIAQQQGFNVTEAELHPFFNSMHSNNQELDDSQLVLITGGQAEWYAFWTREWWSDLRIGLV